MKQTEIEFNQLEDDELLKLDEERFQQMVDDAKLRLRVGADEPTFNAEVELNK